MSAEVEKTAVVTGANRGIGYETALALALRGINVVLACRHPGRMRSAADSIRDRCADVRVDEVTLDLGNLHSVHNAARNLADRHPRIDILVNNAGVLTASAWTTCDGFEMQFGVNHLGHFALTLLLLDRLLEAPAARVVTVSSIAHRWARTDVEQWPDPSGCKPLRAYAASKLANLLFALELHRRLEWAGLSPASLACHPGWSSTDLPHLGLLRSGRRVSAAGFKVLGAVVGQSAGAGALPAVRCATDVQVPSGSYLGPTRLGRTRGPAGLNRPTATAADPALARRLWAMSEKLVQISHPVLTD